MSLRIHSNVKTSMVLMRADNLFIHTYYNTYFIFPDIYIYIYYVIIILKIEILQYNIQLLDFYKCAIY